MLCENPTEGFCFFMFLKSNLVTHVKTDQPISALTFDDGPHPVYTPQVLAVLEKHNAKATFFMVGEAVSRYPQIVKDVARAGHAIGNHSWNHPYLPHIQSRPRRLKQLWDCAKVTAPHCQRLFRPPFGAQNAQIRFDARLFRYRVILWNASAQDWTLQDSQEIAQKLIDRVTPGSIFLLHDAIYPGENVNMSEQVPERGAMVSGLDQALSVLKKKFTFVTVPEILAAGEPACHWPLST